MASKVRGEFDLFRVAGVQIAIDFSWLIIFVLVLWGLSSGYFPALHPGYPLAEYWLVGAVGTVLFFTSIVIHELSHAMVGNYLGQPVERISLFIFGGMAHLGHEPTDANAELKIAAAGPITSIVLGIVFLWIARAIGPTGPYPMWSSVFQYLGFINIALALFNLLPGFPLDGGRILRALVWRRTGRFPPSYRARGGLGPRDRLRPDRLGRTGNLYGIFDGRSLADLYRAFPQGCGLDQLSEHRNGTGARQRSRQRDYGASPGNR